MKRAYRIIPIYTGDVSGVASALYDMGGMVVMHDPSGCNSTYNTHDETRWYDRDSLIFISGMSEMDAIMGNDDKFVRAVVRAAEALSPAFIALCTAPIPYMNGTDFEGLARLIEAETGIPSFFVKTNGMHDYVAGAGEALKEIARRFVLPAEEVLPHSLNILGLTPLDYGTPDARDSMVRELAARDWQTVSVWGMGDSLDAISAAGAASVNLVVSALGLPAAEALRAQFGTPYVVGTPVGAFTGTLAEAMERAVETGTCRNPLLERPGGTGARVMLLGEIVTMGSLAWAMTSETGCSAQVVCPLEQCRALLGPGDTEAQGEEEIAAAMVSADVIVADPLYRPIVPAGTPFVALPHQAFSGRCFQRDMVSLTDFDFSGLLGRRNGP